MAYIKMSELKAYLAYQGEILLKSMAVKTASTETTVFLSHSHHDQEFVEAAKIFLRKHGVNVYIDWKDPTVPEITSPETAEILKGKIIGCAKFIMLATDRSLSSRWVPWELGFSDSQKGVDNIAILPVSTDYGDWKGNEYVGIYPKIETASDGRWSVFPAGLLRGCALQDWLKRR